MNLKQWNNRSPVRVYLESAVPPKEAKTVGLATYPWRVPLNNKDIVKERHVDGVHPNDRPAVYTRDAHDAWLRQRYGEVDIFEPIIPGRLR